MNKKTIKKDKNQIDKTTYPASIVSLGTHSTNAGLKHFFKTKEEIKQKGYMDLSELLGFDHIKKVKGSVRIAYQIPECPESKCGRSFEDAFILANLNLFELEDNEIDQLENAVFERAEEIGTNSKADFAIEYAIDKKDWTTPRYIIEGLEWLTEKPSGTVNLVTAIKEAGAI